MEFILNWFAISFIILFATIILLPKKQKHDILHHGYPDGLKEKDEYGFQDTYKCKYCDCTLTTDSNGDWFHLN